MTTGVVDRGTAEGSVSTNEAGGGGRGVWIADSGSSRVTTAKEDMRGYGTTDGTVGLPVANGTTRPIKGYGSLTLLEKRWRDVSSDPIFEA